MSDSLRIQRSVAIQQDGTYSANSSVENTESFENYLEQAKGVSFSNHAQKRLQVRSIEIDDEGIGRLVNAVNKAEAHGSKDSLILMDDLAFIVNVEKRMVVTTMDVNQRKDGVFTQIDSVVLADENEK